jgi:hypothetical protein
MNLATAAKSVQKLQDLKQERSQDTFPGLGLGFSFIQSRRVNEEFKSEESKNNRFEVSFMIAGNCPPLA